MRWTAGNRGGDRHVSHDVLIAAAGEPGEKRAGGLDAVLRIAGQPDDGVLNVFRAQIGAIRACRDAGNSFTHGKKTVTEFALDARCNCVA